MQASTPKSAIIIDRFRGLCRSRWVALALMYAVVYIILRYFETELPVGDIHVDYLQKHLRRCADALLFTLPLCFIRRRGYVTAYVLVVSAYIFTNILYNRTYHTLMPMSAYLMVGNLDGIGESVVNSFVASDLKPAIAIIAFLAYYWIVNPGKPLRGTLYQQRSRRRMVIAGLLSAAIVVGVYSQYYIRYDRDELRHPMLSYRIDKINSFLTYGFPNYWVYSMCANGKPTEEESLMVDEYFSRSQSQDFSPIVENAGKNLIVILVESMQSWPIDIVVEGKEVTPYINALRADTNNLFFLKVLPQVKHGRSSDAQLLLNTGLLPINDGATAFLYGDNTYPSLPKALAKKGYKSYSLVCDDKEYWNQHITCGSYGFDKIYDRLGICPGERNWIHADELLVKNAARILPQLESPFFAQIVTMSGHDVVDNDLQNDFTDADIDNALLKNQLKIYRYEDEQIGYLIDYLKDSGIYERSVVVITGDHDAIGLDVLDGRTDRELSDRFIPFIVLNSPVLAETDIVMGQSDIYPTLLDIMGLDYEWRGLGESVLRAPSGFAVYRTGEVCGTVNTDSVIEQKSRLWDVSDIIIRQDYFKTHPVEHK